MLCGLSGSLTQLVIFRVIQGIGGGLIIPVGQAMLFRTFPPERRARAAGMVVLGTALGPATGPVLGGVLTTYLSWRWCFFVNVPFGTAALVIGLLFLAEHREPAAGRLDIAGFLLAGGGLALFLYALSEAPVRGWGSPVIIGTGVDRPGRAGRAGGGRAAVEGADAEPAAAAQPDLPHHQPGLAVPARAPTAATCSSCPSSCSRPAGPRR